MTHIKSWLKYAVAGVCSHPSANLPAQPLLDAVPLHTNTIMYMAACGFRRCPARVLPLYIGSLGFDEVICEMQEEQFEETCALVREVGFDRVNTAAYSPRPNTPAAVRQNQIADLIKADRLNRLNRIVNEVAEERAQRFVGTVSEVSALLTCMTCAHMCCA